MFMPLETPRLVLRPLTSADAEAVFGYRSLPEVARYQGWVPASADEVRGFIAAMVEAPAPGAWFQLGLVLRETGRLAGDCGIHVSDADPRQAEFGITLAPEHQGRGLATEALVALFGCLFGTLGMHRVTGSVDPCNTASMALLARCGMRQEALHLESLWFKGAWADDAVFALLRREWEARRS